MLICDRPGFTRGAFYSNFASKEELFPAIYEVQMQERTERLRVAVTEATAAVDPASADAITRVLQDAGPLFMEPLTADETWCLLTVEFRAQALRQPELRAPAAAAERRFHDALAEILLDLLDRIPLTRRHPLRAPGRFSQTGQRTCPLIAAERAPRQAALGGSTRRPAARLT